MSENYDIFADYEAYGDELVGKILVGDHDVTVKTARPRISNSGKAQIGFTLEIESGPDAGKTIEDLFTWSPENETARRMGAMTLSMMGATPEWIRENNAKLFDIAEHVTGARVAIKVTEGEFNGMPQARVRYVRSLGHTTAAAAAAPVPTLGQAPQAQTAQTAQTGAWPSL